MAQAYSTYLSRQGILTRLTADDVTADIPLYIESFGSVEVIETIMSFPVTVDKPLTTLNDVGTMYDELAEEGVKNINFRLTGFANGGMYSVVPTKIKWEKSVGGKDGFQALVDYAAEVNAKGDGSNLGIFPDFDGGGAFTVIGESRQRIADRAVCCDGDIHTVFIDIVFFQNASTVSKLAAKGGPGAVSSGASFQYFVFCADFSPKAPAVFRGHSGAEGECKGFFQIDGEAGLCSTGGGHTDGVGSACLMYPAQAAGFVDGIAIQIELQAVAAAL